jgi:hypothetical protein
MQVRRGWKGCIPEGAVAIGFFFCALGCVPVLLRQTLLVSRLTEPNSNRFREGEGRRGRGGEGGPFPGSLA